MKNIKVLCLILLASLLGGCKASYNLDITNNSNFKETIYLTAENNDEQIQINDYNFPIPLSKFVNNEQNPDIDYDRYTQEKDGNTINFTGIFNKSTIVDSTAISVGVDYFDFSLVKGHYLLRSSNNIILFDNYNVSELNVNITLPNEVYYHNADSVNGNTYTWNISKDNKKSIYLDYKPIDNKEITGTKEEDNNLKYILIAIGFLVLLLVGLIFIKKNKYKQ